MGKMTNKIFILVALLYLGSLTSGCQQASNPDYELVHSGRGFYRNLTWSPDGERISFSTAPEAQFFVVDLQDGQETSLPIDAKGIRGPSTMQWPIDGEISYSLSYIEPSEEINSFLTRYSLDDEETYPLLSSRQIFEACWSGPTQSYVLATHTARNYRMYSNRLVVYDPVDESLVRLFRAVPPNGDVIDIACDQSQGRVAAVVRGGRSNRTWHSLIIFDIESQRSEAIFETLEISVIDSPTWSPDGNWIAIRTIQRRRDVPYRGIKLISVNDGEARIVMRPNASFSPGELAWSPDDNRLLFSSPHGFRGYGLYILDLTPWLEE
jgi:dipeptidyl aminopeptidase/acylaminoacyl peptidase